MSKIKAVLVEVREDQNEESIRASLIDQNKPKVTPKAAVAQGSNDPDLSKGLPIPRAKPKAKAKESSKPKADVQTGTGGKGGQQPKADDKNKKDKGKGKGEGKKDSGKPKAFLESSPIPTSYVGRVIRVGT